MAARHGNQPALRHALSASLMGLSLVAFTGCATVNAYRSEPVVTRSAFTVIENYTTESIDPDKVDAVFLEVTALLGVTLDPGVRKPHVVVTSPDVIARLYNRAAAGRAGHEQAAAAYIPRASVVLIPYFDRPLLGHELAHYLTEHYLDVPRDEWEDIAYRIEWRLSTRRAPARAATPPASVIAAPTTPGG